MEIIPISLAAKSREVLRNWPQTAKRKIAVSIGVVNNDVVVEPSERLSRIRRILVSAADEVFTHWFIKTIDQISIIWTTRFVNRSFPHCVDDFGGSKWSLLKLKLVNTPVANQGSETL